MSIEIDEKSFNDVEDILRGKIVLTKNLVRKKSVGDGIDPGF